MKITAKMSLTTITVNNKEKKYPKLQERGNVLKLLQSLLVTSLFFGPKSYIHKAKRIEANQRS